MSESATQHAFQAEVNQVLDIVVHSLYSHREIFLRELISNAADAIDKLRFRSVTEHELMEGDDELKIRLAADREARTLTVTDNGIGMSHDEMIENLGTIAHSGSKRFVEALKEKDQAGDVDLIGRFGVGFYSSFLVADRVEVVSRAAGSDEAWRWTSAAEGTFTVEPAERDGRGTDIILYLGEEHGEFADEMRIRHLVRTYSDYVGHPIELEVERTEGEGDDAETVKSWEVINKASALWTRPKSDIDDEQYADFYRHLTHDYEEPRAWTHFKIEGTQLFTGLLFIPKHPPFDLFDRNQKRGVRLYVKRVFIMDDCEEILPEWLRFVRGIIDSDDLPLNVSRELLQEDKITRAIRKNVVKKTLDRLKQLASDAPEDYRGFWLDFGAVLKEGLHFDPDHKDRLAELVRYPSSKAELTSLDEYIERMPEDQEHIYYVIGPTRAAVEASPHIEGLLERGREVLYMTDSVDEWAVHGLAEYKEKKLVSAMKGDLDLDEKKDDDSEEKDEEKKLVVLSERFEEVLKDRVSEVRTSSRLVDSPCCLVVPEGGMHAHIERMLRAQNADMPATKRILEVNPDHPVIQKLDALNEAEPTSEDVGEWIALLYDQALLAEGSPIEDSAGFARRMSKLMQKVL